MVLFMEYIKIFVEWWPNMGAMEARKAMQFDDIVVNTSDSDNELTQVTSRWLTKYRNRILLYSLILMLLAIGFFISEGKNRLDVFMTGIISALVVSLFTGLTEWCRLNKVAAGEFKRLQVTRKQMLINYLVIIGLENVHMHYSDNISPSHHLTHPQAYDNISPFH